jgi:hypothetical protein
VLFHPSQIQMLSSVSWSQTLSLCALPLT